MHFNDSPIERPEDDRYGITGFAHALADSVLGIKEPMGTTIAINGPWGSGKSSAVNLIRSHLEARKDERLTIIDFKCWWYRGEEAIALAFLQELNKALQNSLGERVKGLIPEIGQHILQAGPVIGSAVALATGTGGVGALVSGSANFVKRFFPEKAPLEATYKKLVEALSSQPRRFLIVIDDIDRLLPEEALAIFRLVKSVGRLPNVMYLLVFDRALADAAVQARYPSEGPHFLEKIIQVSFELPPPASSDLNGAVLTAAEQVCGTPPEDQVVRFMNLFYDVVAPYLTTARHVSRLTSAIAVTWPPLAGDVSRADFLALETLRLYEPQLYRAIRRHRELLVGAGSGSASRDEARFAPFLQGIPEASHAQAKVILQRLFPRLEGISYSGASAVWDAERRVCIGEHFDTYFRLSLSDDAVSAKDIAELVERADDAAFIRQYLLDASARIRRSGKSMAPVVLDALTTHGANVDARKVPVLLATLFGVADAITRVEDAERGFAFASTPMRLNWLIRRLMEDRFDLDQKSEMLVAATQTASLGWLIDFTDAMVRSYSPTEGRTIDPSRLLVTEASLTGLKAQVLGRIRQAAESGELMQAPYVIDALYLWRAYGDDGGEQARTWANHQLEHDEALVRFARALTGESWTTGMGGFGSLGDRVSKRVPRAQITPNFDLFDLNAFRAGLERIVREERLNTGDLEAIRAFLQAWDNRRSGRDD